MGFLLVAASFEWLRFFLQSLQSNFCGKVLGIDDLLLVKVLIFIYFVTFDFLVLAEYAVEGILEAICFVTTIQYVFLDVFEHFRT